MRKCTTRYRAFFLCVAPLFCVSGSASASLFATFSLNQALDEYGSPFSNSNEVTPVTDTALPFQQTVSQISATNGVTTTYDAYDNGNAAGLAISTSAYTTAVNNDVEEGTPSDIILFNASSTTFSFTQSVNYTIGYQITGTAYGGSFEIGSASGDIIALFQPPTFLQSGTMSPEVVYTLKEFWGLNNINNSAPANLAGADAISLTFTAIPEPGSLGLMLLPAALLARRRRRKASERVQSPP